MARVEEEVCARRSFCGKSLQAANMDIVTNTDKLVSSHIGVPPCPSPSNPLEPRESRENTPASSFNSTESESGTVTDPPPPPPPSSLLQTTLQNQEHG